MHLPPAFRLLLPFALFLAAAFGQPASRPNIVIILADDLGFNDLGFQGSPDVVTPNIDTLARGGIRFTSGYVTHPFCSPTRAGLMTGRYQQRYGHENNMVFSRADAVAGLPLDEVTLADAMRSAGYKTGLVGKWHLGAHPRFHPMKRGFQEMYGFVGGGHDYFEAGTPEATDQHFILLERDGKPVDKMGYLTLDLGREAGEFVRRHTKEPFFLYLAFNAPHSPLQAPESYLDRFATIKDKNRRIYVAMMAAMDDAVGNVMKALRESGAENNTLVFFLNDNGGPTGNASSNRPLRGTKRTVYEGGVRVPFAIRWPGHIPAGKVVDTPVSSLDVFPTSLAAAGAPVPAKHELDGINLLPYLENGGAGIPQRALFWRMFGGVYSAVRDGKYKLVQNPDSAPELYDLEKDLSETTDLAAQQPETVKRLQAEYQKWNAEMIPPRWKDHIWDFQKH